MASGVGFGSDRKVRRSWNKRQPAALVEAEEARFWAT